MTSIVCSTTVLLLAEVRQDLARMTRWSAITGPAAAAPRSPTARAPRQRRKQPQPARTPRAGTLLREDFLVAALVSSIAGEMLDRTPVALRLNDGFASLPKQIKQPLRAWLFRSGHARERRHLAGRVYASDARTTTCWIRAGTDAFGARSRKESHRLVRRTGDDRRPRRALPNAAGRALPGGDGDRARPPGSCDL